MAPHLLPPKAMKFKTHSHSTSRIAIHTLLAAGLFSPLLADSLKQPESFFTSNEGIPYTGTGSENLANSGYFTASFDPFPSSLGTLTAFTVNCEINGQLSGLVAQDVESGTASGSLGGTFFINGSAFNGTGGSNGTGAGVGQPLEVGFGIPAFEQTLTTANAGVTYDPAILSTVTGENPFNFTYNTSVTIGFTNVETLDAQVAGSLSITYHYTPINGGPPSTITVTSIVRNASSGDVSLTWTSSDQESYSVDASENLKDWTVIERFVFGEPATTSHMETGIPANTTRRFYRIRERN
jgi:hypothetical protein